MPLSKVVSNSLSLTTLAASGAATLSSTLGVTGVTTVQAGTAALPAITTTGDTNTGIFFPAADTIAFSEGGAEAMRIDSSGNVGIGTSSPATKLDVNGLITGRNGVKVTGALASTVATSTFFIEQDSASSSRILVAGADAGTPPTFSTVLLNNAGGVFGSVTQYDSGLSVKSLGINGTTPSSSGAGITFPATQSASSNANTLDDYEEGTWTPSVGGNATYTTQAGTYTKVGNIVTAWFDIQINVLGTGATGSILGLPYVSRTSPSNPQGMAGMVGFFLNIATASTLILVRVDNNTTTAILANTAGVTTGVLGNDIYKNSARTTGTIVYQANA